jgi:hypothetical protein
MDAGHSRKRIIGSVYRPVHDAVDYGSIHDTRRMNSCRHLLCAFYHSAIVHVIRFFALLFDWNVLGLKNLDIGFVYWRLLIWSGPAWAFPIRTEYVTIFLNVVAKGGTIRWNWHITPICAWPPRGCTIYNLGKNNRATAVSTPMKHEMCWQYRTVHNFFAKKYKMPARLQCYSCLEFCDFTCTVC